MTKAFFASVVLCNGRSHGYAERAVATSVLSTGHQTVRDMLLGILGNPSSMQDGLVEVQPSPAAPTKTPPMVNTEVEAGPTTTKSSNEDNGRRIYITKRMVSEFGAT